MKVVNFRAPKDDVRREPFLEIPRIFFYGLVAHREYFRFVWTNVLDNPFLERKRVWKIDVFSKIAFLRGDFWLKRRSLSSETFRCNRYLGSLCSIKFSDLKLIGIKSYELRKFQKMNHFSYFEKLIKLEAFHMVQRNFQGKENSLGNMLSQSFSLFVGMLREILLDEDPHLGRWSFLGLPVKCS